LKGLLNWARAGDHQIDPCRYREAPGVKTVILCGGLGTRLREETEYRPKPMVDIGGRPILWHIMKLYAHHGFREFVLCLGYKGHVIKEYFLNYEALNNDFTMCLGRDARIRYDNSHEEQNFTVTLADTGLNTMTGGRIKRIQKYVDNSRFLMTYGDGVADVDIPELLRFHESHGKLATLTSVRPVSRFGVIDLEGEKVTHFLEKPQEKGWINGGFFVLEPGVFDYLGGDSCVLEGEPLERLAADGQLMAYRHEGFFFAMDTYREYLYLNELWQSGKAPWRVWA
jgi:glucose-1-phosphate cytidylyltransferase